MEGGTERFFKKQQRHQEEHGGKNSEGREEIFLYNRRRVHDLLMMHRNQSNTDGDGSARLIQACFCTFLFLPRTRCPPLYRHDVY